MDKKKIIVIVSAICAVLVFGGIAVAAAINSGNIRTGKTSGGESTAADENIKLEETIGETAEIKTTEIKTTSEETTKASTTQADTAEAESTKETETLAEETTEAEETTKEEISTADASIENTEAVTQAAATNANSAEVKTEASAANNTDTSNNQNTSNNSNTGNSSGNTSDSTPAHDTNAQGLPYDIVSLNTAKKTTQIVLVVGDGSLTGNTVYLFEKGDDLVWRKTMETPGHWGRNGISYHTFEGDQTTPAGVFDLGLAFGNKPNPGTALNWVDVNPYMYWIDDLNSDYYNLLIDSREVPDGWSSGEHLSEIVPSYNYSINIEVNPNRTKDSTSAIFFHCGKGATAGCVAIPESYMVTALQKLRPGAKIIIAENSSTVGQY